MLPDARTKTAFLLLVLAQGAHSVEEYLFRLYEVFPPARFASGLVSADLATGFVILNAGFFVFGMWCYLARVRAGHPSAATFIWGWAIVELANGAAHLAISAARADYLPGAMTSPVLILLAAFLVRRLTDRG